MKTPKTPKAPHPTDPMTNNTPPDIRPDDSTPFTWGDQRKRNDERTAQTFQFIAAILVHLDKHDRAIQRIDLTQTATKTLLELDPSNRGAGIAELRRIADAVEGGLPEIRDATSEVGTVAALATLRASGLLTPTLRAALAEMLGMDQGETI